MKWLELIRHIQMIQNIQYVLGLFYGEKVHQTLTVSKQCFY